MVYPVNFEIKSGFNSIRASLHSRCLIDYSHGLVDSMSFITDYNQLQKLLGQVAEMKYIIQFHSSFPQQDYFDLSPELSRLKIKGTFTDSETLLALKLSLEAITEIIKFITNLEDKDFVELKSILPYSMPDKNILEAIKKIVDDKGEVRDSASTRLSTVRKEIRSRVSSIDRKINQILMQARKDNLVSDDSELTIRNGRLVIPMPSGNKRKLRGYVHDTSATGQTVFIEPAEVFEINNDIQNLKVEEKQEIINILTGFADLLRPSIDELLVYYKFLGEIDFIRAKANLALDFHAIKPVLVNEPLVSWMNAVHPHLMRTLEKSGKKIVSQEIDLDRDNRIMIISGPNAGGKSVCLQTVALLQYMLQCGLLIPVHEDSKAGIFNNIFLEIGDEQSLENDLSTYSSHLFHIKYFLENADDKTLFLIDEFGAGTEPQLGGAMAEASLEKLNSLRSFGVVTTHYTNLKLMADNNKGLFNAAMLYDTNEMRPLFKLSSGKPGSSFAFEIAQKIGFPKDVLSMASSKIGVSQLDFEKQLTQLELDKKQIADKIAELKVADEMLAELVERYQKLMSELEFKKSNVIKDAKQKAQTILSQSNKIIENTIREIRETQAEKDTTKRLRENLAQQVEELILASDDTDVEVDVIAKKHERKVTERPLLKGSYVKMEGQESIGQIEDLKGSKALVLFGEIKIRTGIDKLIHATSGEIKQHQSNLLLAGRGHSINSELNAKMAEFKMSIDIRSKKPEEAKELIARYIDQAILLRIHEVRILHGKGNGVLRTLVHNYLNDTPEVLKFEDEKLERGGHGVTLVYFK